MTSRKASLTILVLLSLAIGCASVSSARKIVTEDGITPKRDKRRQEVAGRMGQKRDFAEYEAAKNRWQQQGDPNGCREGLEKLLARNPKHCEGRLLLAELLLDEDDPRAAYKEAKAALDEHPNDGRVQYTMGLVFDALGKPTDALAYYERAKKMAPDNEVFAAAYQSAREASREKVRASTNGTLQIPAATEEELAEAVLTSHEAAEAATPLPASKRNAKGSDRNDSNSSDELAENESPGQDWLQKGQAALAQGDTEKALECFREAMAAAPRDHQVAISAAAAALRANQADVAVKILKPAAKRFPNVAAIQRSLGAAYYRSGDYRSSQVALQQALSLDKSSALSYLLMGYTLAKLGQREAAEAHLRQARVLDPRYSIVR